MKNKRRFKITPFDIAFCGIFAALTVAVSLLERIFTASLPLPPGVKPGLGNVAVMLVCFIEGPVYAYLIIVIKAFFVFVVSGPSGAFISLCGGVLSVTAMYAVYRLAGEKTGNIGISVTGAVFHNCGQLLASGITVGSALYLNYAPVLLVSAVLCGILTGIIMNYAGPAVSRVADKHR